MDIQKLREMNPNLPLYRVTDPEFNEYGCVIEMDTKELVEKAQKIEKPASGSAYVPTQPNLETVAVRDVIEKVIYGEMPIQIGYCWGENDHMCAMEWHKGSEINVGVTPLILLLGKVQDIQNGKYDSAKIKGFLLEQGEAVEVYGTSLHYCPCQVKKDGFGCIVVLPKDTNTPLRTKSKDPYLYAKNKWLLCHENEKTLIEKGVPGTISGENWVVKY